MRLRLPALVAAIVPLVAVRAGAASLRVTSSAVCAASDEECRAVEQAFTEDVGALRFVTVVEGATGEAWVEHVWKRDGREVFRLRLPLKGSRYRTMSKKTVSGLAGEWTALVLDPVGRELAKVSFRVDAN